MINSIFAGLALAGLSKLTAPKAPSERRLPKFDFDKETIAAMQARRDAQDPQMRAVLEQNYKTALALTRGDIPEEVQQTIRTTMAENASTRGLSPAQFTRINAQALGATQMDMMERGRILTQTLDAIRSSEWAVAADSALGKANRQFEAFALSERQRMATYQQQSAENASMWNMLGTGVFSGLETRNNNEQRALDRQFYADMYKTSGGASAPVRRDFFASYAGLAPARPKPRPTSTSSFGSLRYNDGSF